MTRSLRVHGERGSIAVEVAVIAPALVFLMLLVVYAGKVSEADGNVERAASDAARARSEEHTSELQSLMRISYAVFCLKKNNKHMHTQQLHTSQEYAFS